MCERVLVLLRMRSSKLPALSNNREREWKTAGYHCKVDMAASYVASTDAEKELLILCSKGDFVVVFFVMK